MNLTGSRYRYLALLPDYELPIGWCICSGESTDCGCREPKRGGAAARLLKCDPIDGRDRSLQVGERYRDAFVLADDPATLNEHVDVLWRATLAQRWT